MGGGNESQRAPGLPTPFRRYRSGHRALPFQFSGIAALPRPFGARIFQAQPEKRGGGRRSVVEAEDPDDGDILLGRGVDHHRSARVVGGRRGHEHAGLGRPDADRVLPDADHEQQRRGQSATERPAMTQDCRPPAATRRYRPDLALVLDAADHALPESGPVRLSGRQIADQEPMETAQLTDLPLAPPTRGEMGGRRARRLLVQGAIEVGPQAPSRPIAGQHRRWTDPPPTVILSAG